MLPTNRGGRVLRWLPSILPQLLPLLAEPQPEVRAAAAPCLGVLGAQAAIILPTPVPSHYKASSHPVPASSSRKLVQAPAPPHPLPPALYGRAQRQAHSPPPTPVGCSAQPIQSLPQHQGRKGPAAPPQPPRGVAPKPVPSSDPPSAFFNWCLEALSRDSGSGVKAGAAALSAGVKVGIE
jgi:hypothetical protein